MAAPHPPHVSLKRFAGLPNENWDQFEGLLRASIAVARIPADHNQQARYLHLHLDGNALNYYLRLPENTRNDLDDALEQLRNRYSGPDQRRNFELDLQSRKFDPVKEQPDDFLTDLQRLANLAIVDDVGAGIDRNDERTRRIREQFIQGMPFKYKKVLLRELDNVGVNDLCSIVKRRLRIDQLNPEPAHTTAFNSLTSSQNSAFNQAVENIMAAGIVSIQASVSQTTPPRWPNTTQNKFNKPFTNYNRNNTAYRTPNQNRSFSGYQNRPFYRGRGRGTNVISRYNNQSQQYNQRQRSPTPMRTFCRICASNEHTARDCTQRQPPYRDATMPFNQQPKN